MNIMVKNTHKMLHSTSYCATIAMLNVLQQSNYKTGKTLISLKRNSTLFSNFSQLCTQNGDLQLLFR